MPINEEMPIEKREAQTYDPIPEDVYQVELIDITMKEQPKYKQPEETEKVFDFQFTLLEGKDAKGEDLRGRNLWRNFVPTYLYISSKNGKNLLYQIVESILGEELSPEQEAKMDTSFLNSLIGGQCRVGVKNKPVKDKVYSNIDQFYPAKKKLKALNEEEKEKARVKEVKEGEGETNKETEPIKVEDVL